jgi:hypothetical protein
VIKKAQGCNGSSYIPHSLLDLEFQRQFLVQNCEENVLISGGLFLHSKTQGLLSVMDFQLFPKKTKQNKNKNKNSRAALN